MAEPTKSVTPAPFTFDTKKFEEKIETIKTFMTSKFAGKKGVNPFAWLHKHVKPLEDKYAMDGDRSKELWDKLHSLQYENVIPEVYTPHKYDGSDVKNRG